MLEVQLATGFGPRAAGSLISLATAPAVLRDLVLGAMGRGEAGWAQVRTFIESTGRLSGEQKLLVATALFGTQADQAASERLDEHGQLVTGMAWSHPQFTAACAREALAAEGQEVTAERARRQRAYARRRASVRMHDDGTATLSLTGPAVTMSAIYQRIDRAARTARTQGDERTLANLRADIINTLLLYGTITLDTTTTHSTQTETDTTDAPGTGTVRPAVFLA